jgi:hypothetical protein
VGFVGFKGLGASEISSTLNVVLFWLRASRWRGGWCACQGSGCMAFMVALFMHEGLWLMDGSCEFPAECMDLPGEVR